MFRILFKVSFFFCLHLLRESENNGNKCVQAVTASCWMYVCRWSTEWAGHDCRGRGNVRTHNLNLFCAQILPGEV